MGSVLTPARANSRRSRRTRRNWLLLTLTMCVVVLVPVVVAASVTTHPADSTFVRQPWWGFAFAGTVLRTAFTARAASPGAALERANDEFRDDPVATGVELVYTPGGHHISFEGLSDEGEVPVRVDPPRPLVWQVRGTWEGSGAEGIIGLLDFSSGSLVWDVRTHTGDMSKDQP